MQSERFRQAIAAIDAANADDPNLLTVRGVERPKEQAHAEMLMAWMQRLRPNADDALLLAARAHHIRRWTVPRETYPDGRGGYLRWRTGLYRFHADTAAAIVREAGYGEETANRVHALVGKTAKDADGQAMEDGLCLVFLETQLADLRGKLPDAKMVDVLRKTWRKMSPAGRDAALALDLPADQRDFVIAALNAESES